MTFDLDLGTVLLIAAAAVVVFLVLDLVVAGGGMTGGMMGGVAGMMGTPWGWILVVLLLVAILALQLTGWRPG